MGEVGGHQHGVARREGAGLTVAHTGEDHVGALARASTVTADCDVEGWCRIIRQGKMKCISEDIIYL